MQSRWRDATIDPVSVWPLGVHVYRLLNDEARDLDVLRRGDVMEAFGGEIYQTFAQAKDQTR